MVCTDKGRHPRKSITHVSKSTAADGSVSHGMWSPGSSPSPVRWGPPDESAASGSGLSRRSYQFDCPVCAPRNHKVIDGERWWAAVRSIVETTDFTEIDISLLS